MTDSRLHQTDPAASAAEVQNAFERIRTEVRKVIVGQEEVVEEVLIAIFCGGHAIIEGVPGLAKTLLVHTLSSTLNLDFSRVQFTPDLMPSDMTGTEVIEEDKTTGQRNLRFVPGPIFANIILADEINRTPPKTQGALLEAMQERQVTAGGESHALPNPFFVLATQNPIEQEGTYPLPEAQVDRFLMKLVVRYPDREEERRILDRMAKTTTDLEIEAVIEPADIAHARTLVDRIHVDDRIRDYVVDLVVATREPGAAGLRFAELLDFGASPRATIALVLVAKARAFLAGRGYVVPQDVKDAAPDVLRHRLGLSYEAEAEERTADDLISEMLDHVPVP